MKKLALAGMIATIIAMPVSQAGAVGCLTGAVAGGVAGHYAGHHGVVGAVGGCVAGHALHKKQVAARKLKHQQELQQQQTGTAPAQAAQPAQ